MGENHTEVQKCRLGVKGLLNRSELVENKDHDFANERDCDSFTEPEVDASGGVGSDC